MNSGKSIFAQLMDFLPSKAFRRCVKRYRGDYNLQSFSCWDQFLCMAFAQLTYRESLRDIEACPRNTPSSTISPVVNAFLTKLSTMAILITNIPEEYRYERDPDDEMYVNLAIVANASYLVSRDQDLLDLMTTSTDIARQFRSR